MTRDEPETTRSHLKPHVKWLLKMWSHGSNEKSHELRQEPGTMDFGLRPSFRSLRTLISAGSVVESTRKKRWENANIRSNNERSKKAPLYMAIAFLSFEGDGRSGC